MSSEEKRLSALAAAVLDGREIDWEKAERGSSGEKELRMLQELRVMAGIARSYAKHQALDPPQATPNLPGHPPVQVSRSTADFPASHGAMPQQNGAEGAARESLESTSELSTETSTRRPAMPTRIGDYRIVRKLGEGGMGVVYEAEQQHPRRPVAMKVIRGAGSADDTRIRMFQREAQSLARLKHPGIAAIYESGQTADGEHFLAMELVRGVTLSEFLRSRPSEELSEEEINLRLGLFRRVCEAVNYAHQRGVIHRDLKPSNIIVLRESIPTSGAGAVSAVPDIKILDFGLARITDADMAVATVLTEIGKVHGTLPYMSPEQVRGNPDEIDLRTDVYSLGVILYEILTGTFPYEIGKTPLTEAVRIICEAPARPLGKLWRGKRKADSDVETISRMALEKEPARRYQSALALGEDVGRYLEHHPILARPPSTLYLIRKLMIRHKVPFGFATAIVVLLLGFAVTVTFQAKRIARERDRANLEGNTAQKISEFLVSLFQVSDPGKARGNTITAREILDKGSEKIARDLQGQPLTQARLMDTMGSVYRSLGLYEQAAPLLEKAVQLKESVLGGADPEVARSLNDLGWLYTSQGRRAEARPLHERALGIFEQAFGSESTDVAWSRYYLGSLFVRTGNGAEAKPQLEAALAIFEKNLGPTHFAVAWCLNDLAYVYGGLGQYAEAVRLYERALKIKEQTLGLDHPDTAMALNNVVDTRMLMGDLTGAKPVLEEALAIQEKALGPNHPQLAYTLHSYGELLRRMGDLAAARPVLERALAINEKFGHSSYAYTEILESLAILSEEMGRYDEAEAHYQRALAISEGFQNTQSERLSSDPPGLGFAMLLEHYASLLRKTHRIAEAEKLEVRARAIRARAGAKPLN